MKLVLIAFLIAILNQEVSHGEFFGPINVYMADIPGKNWVKGKVSSEPDNGPEIVIPDSDTWTPADGEWPKCEGTVECKFVGFHRKCRCRKSKPTLELLKKSPIPDSEVNVYMADIPRASARALDIPGKNWVKPILPVGTGSKTTVKHLPHPEPSFPSDFCQRSGWRLIFKGTKDYWSNYGAIYGKYHQQCPPISWYGDTCEPFEDVHMRYYPCPGWRDNRHLWCHVNFYGRISCKSIYGWKRKFGYFHHGGKLGRGSRFFDLGGLMAGIGGAIETLKPLIPVGMQVLQGIMGGGGGGPQGPPSGMGPGGPPPGMGPGGPPPGMGPGGPPPGMGPGPQGPPPGGPGGPPPGHEAANFIVKMGQNVLGAIFG